MITMRLYDPAGDYPLVASWWAAHGVAVTPAACVPKLGAIALDGGIPVFAAWVSMDNSCGLCSLLWPVANPQSTPRKIASAIPITVDLLQRLVRDMGYHTMVAITHVPSIVRSLGRHGFTVDPLPVQTLYITLTK
jgi:hypothetical protein